MKYDDDELAKKNLQNYLYSSVKLLGTLSLGEENYSTHYYLLDYSTL